MESFVDYCKQYILDHIADHEGHWYYGGEVGYHITQGANCDGTLTHSTAEAKRYLGEWWDECGEYWEYEKGNFGEHFHNPFDEPEAYMVCMVIEGVNSILGNCPCLDNSWNEELELTGDVIREICDYAKNFETEGSLF